MFINEIFIILLFLLFLFSWKTNELCLKQMITRTPLALLTGIMEKAGKV